MDEQMDPNHWRFKKNKEAGIINRMKDAEAEAKKSDVITFTVGTGPAPTDVVEHSVPATHDGLKGLNREEQVLICKAMKLKGYSELNEEALITKILLAHKASKKKRKGVTTKETFKKKSKSTEIIDRPKEK